MADAIALLAGSGAPAPLGERERGLIAFLAAVPAEAWDAGAARRAYELACRHAATLTDGPARDRAIGESILGAVLERLLERAA